MIKNPHHAKLCTYLEDDAIALIQDAGDKNRLKQTAERIGMTLEEYREFVVHLLYCHNSHEKNALIQQYIQREIAYLLIQRNIQA
jgi:hypothetical protein